MAECPWPPLRRQLGLPALKLQLGKKESHLRCKESWMRLEGTTVKNYNDVLIVTIARRKNTGVSAAATTSQIGLNWGEDPGQNYLEEIQDNQRGSSTRKPLCLVLGLVASQRTRSSPFEVTGEGDRVTSTFLRCLCQRQNSKAFEYVDRESLWKILEMCGFPDKLVNLSTLSNFSTKECWKSVS